MDPYYILLKIEKMLENMNSEEKLVLYTNFKKLHSDSAKWIIK